MGEIIIDTFYIEETQNNNIQETEIIYWFASMVGISSKRKIQIVEQIKSFSQLLSIQVLQRNPFIRLNAKEIQILENSLRVWDFKFEYEKAKKSGVKFVTYCTEHYPERLRNINDPPFALFYKGQLPPESGLSVAIVGARRCSKYGELYAKEFSQALAKNGVNVISGLAKGIDGISQQSALDVGGKTYGVMASGVDICYPREHIGLYKDIINHGGIISEQPLGMHPVTYNFPLRNRIISGLADIIIVIEAKERSGSLITADLALEQGKDVFALPGYINSQLSRGCNRLIKQGAAILLSPQDFFEEIGLMGVLKNKNLEKNEIPLETFEKLVYSCLDLHPKSIQSIFDQTNIPIGELMSILISLDLKGFISEVSKNNYVKLT